jgi:glycosyltransferase involved in cell wall biosynthesis
MEYESELKGLKVAIVHDWLVGLGGAERVVASLLKLFPKADLYTSVYDSSKLDLFKNRKVYTTFLQKWPLAKKKHQLYASLRPLAFESLDFKDYDLVITSASAEAKGIVTPTETIHISFIHTPIRYYWSGYDEYYNNPGFGLLNPLVRLLMPKMVKKLRIWDYAAAQRPDFLIANSKTVQARIKKYYGRDSIVINPSVQLDKFQPTRHSEKEGDSSYFLVVSRLVPYKRVDLAVRACNKLNKKLIVAGKGPELRELKKLAGNTVEFIENPSDIQIKDLYSKARGFIFSAEEDFGITPVEAMASGVPVICYGKGGATETVVDGKTGVYHGEQTVGSLVRAIEKFETIKFNKSKIVERSKDFSESNFLNSFGGYAVEKIQKNL